MAKTSERKADLISAAQRALAEHGSAVRLNQIAEAAGVSSGAILYHYAGIDELLVEANRAGMERFYNERLEMIASIPDPAERLERIISLGVPRSAEDEDVRLLCSLGGEAARNTMYAVLLTSLYDRQVGLYQGILELGVSQGVFHLAQGSLTIARNLVALEDAYGYRIIAKHPTLDYSSAVDLILEYARLATGHALLTSKPASKAHPRKVTTIQPRRDNQ